MKFGLYIFGKLKHVVTLLDKNILKFDSHVKTGGGGNKISTKYMYEKFIQDSEVRLHTRLVPLLSHGFDSFKVYSSRKR